MPLTNHHPLASPPDQVADGDSISYVESLYESFIHNPDSVSPEWGEYFRQLAIATGSTEQSTLDRSLFRSNDLLPTGKPGERAVVPPSQLNAAILQERVDRLIRNYRTMGHFVANIDPLGQPRQPVDDLNPATCGFGEGDLDRQFSTLNSSGPNLRTLSEIINWLQNTYCRSIGAQFMHIDDLRVREWLQNRMESCENRIELTRDEQLRILKRLSDAVVFEDFIQKKFQGAKSFSLEGAETLIPLLELAIYKGAEQGIQEVIIGMAHRGRLNVLANILGKSPRTIFREFADLDPQLHVGRGDVKYHLGFSNDWFSGDGRKVHMSLCFNPSHLEYVNTVAMGRVRAKQDRIADSDRRRVLTVLIHGDAAFAGEGIVQETLNLNELPATRVGGTIHIVVNNQIGFTTPPAQGRSTPYATDVAKMLQIPIFHVNGEDPEAVAQVVRLAMDFRQEFQRDVVVDMYCFRKHGHNEQDEPAFTQPLMYKAIKAHRPIARSYLDRLVQMGQVRESEGDQFISQHRQQLEADLEAAKNPDFVHKWDMLQGIWHGYKGGNESEVADVPTGLEAELLSATLEVISRLPPGFTPHPKLFNSTDPRRGEGILQKRLAMSEQRLPLDWATGELLAFATLALEGHRVRLHGQDVERGTFSSRHAVWHDFETGQAYRPLQHLAADQAPVEIHNSALSESGVLGFEYGYSLDCPDGLICWEAQFGDFVNVAQVIIDQFIVSAEDKWNRFSGLVMLLPHGMEGAGPEHSSARLERFLALAAEDCIQVCYPTNPAQHFHLLRRQVLRKWRKPLIVMTPKYLLRAADATSPLEDFTTGTFQRVLPDMPDRPMDQVRMVLLCSGKVYYDLAKKRDELGRTDVAILRLEQLYPLPTNDLIHQLSEIPQGTPVRWVQEEPHNMGAWWFMKAHYGENLLGKFPLTCVSRPASASPATGSLHCHKLEQAELIAQAFDTTSAGV